MALTASARGATHAAQGAHLSARLHIAWRAVLVVLLLLVAFGLLYVFERVLLMI